MKTSMYEIAQEYRDIEQYILDNDGEASDEVLAAMSCNESDLNAKMDAYAYIINQSEGRVHSLDTEIARLNKRRAVEKNLVIRLKATMLDALTELTEDSKLKTELHNYGTRKSTAVIITDQEQLNDIFMVVVEAKTPDRKAIKRRLSEGHVVSGAHLQENQSLSIR